MASLNKLDSGKWRARVRIKGQTRTASFATKAEAAKWGAEIERQLTAKAHGLTYNAAKFTIGQIIDAYILAQNDSLGRTTEYNLARLKDAIGKQSLANIEPALAGYVDKRLKAAGGATIAGDLSAISAVLKWARVIKNLDVDIDAAKRQRAALTVRKIDTRSQARERFITAKELDLICEAFDANPRLTIPMAEITRFAVASCMRLGEITRIRIEDIDEEARTVIIRQRKHPKKKQDEIVPLLGEAWTLAQARIQNGPRGRLYPFNGPSVGNAFRKVVRDLELPDARFHDLRHTGITLLFRHGLPIQLVSLVSGHKDWAMLKRYTQLNAADVHKQFEALTNG